MAVRFVPVNPEPAPPGKDREQLAEVIQLRSKIVEMEQEPAPASPDALKLATKLLARRALSSGELREQLRKHEVGEQEIEEVLHNFERRHFLDDLSLAQTVCDKLRTTKHASSRQVARKLAERRIPRHIIDEVLQGIDQEEEHVLLRQAATERARKLTSLDRPTAERRLFGYLQRRGWSGSQVMHIVREALDEATE